MYVPWQTRDHALHIIIIAGHIFGKASKVYMAFGTASKVETRKADPYRHSSIICDVEEIETVQIAA